jgi:ATP phosphoribosyltransferase
MLLRGAILAIGRVGLMMDVQKTDLKRILEILPALQTPTIAPLSDGDWVGVNTVIEEKVARNLIPLLKERGARGIVEYPLNKVIE